MHTINKVFHKCIIISLVELLMINYLHADAIAPEAINSNSTSEAQTSSEFMKYRIKELPSTSMITELSKDMQHLIAVDNASIASYQDPCKIRKSERQAWIYMIDSNAQNESMALIVVDCTNKKLAFEASNLFEKFNASGNFLVTDIYQNPNKCLTTNDFNQVNFASTINYICAYSEE